VSIVIDKTGKGTTVMGLHIRREGDVAILANFARLMNDPRYVDAARDVRGMLDEGVRNFVIELAGVRETGDSFLGVLMTITREIRRDGGEAVLAHCSREVADCIAEMKLDDYWDMFATVDEAVRFFHRSTTSGEDQ
jgi:anti-sigma B factor antagonist